MPNGAQTPILSDADVMGVLVVDLVPFTFLLQANATDVPPIRRMAMYGLLT